MSGTFETSPRQTSTDLHNVTFSQALEDGLSHCVWLIGPTTDPSGQALAHASHFLLPERVEGLTMRDTCGPLFGGLSPSADLQASLASRLQAATDVSGSPEYLLTWKQWDMFAGLQICALRASGHPTSGSGCGGWPTVTALVGYGTDDSPTNQRNSPSTSTLLKGWTSPVARDYKGHTTTEAHPGGFTQTLANDVEQAGWPTATSRDHKDGTAQSCENVPDNALLGRVCQLTGPAQSGGPAETGNQGECLPGGWHAPGAHERKAGWTSPKVADDNNDRMGDEAKERELVRPERGGQLAMDAFTAGWRTCTAEDAERGQGSRLESPNTQAAQTAGYPTPTVDDSKNGTQRCGGFQSMSRMSAQYMTHPDMAGWKLNPRFSLWLMGYPAEWACCGERAMQSCRKSRKRSSKHQKAQEKK